MQLACLRTVMEFVKRAPLPSSVDGAAAVKPMFGFHLEMFTRVLQRLVRASLPSTPTAPFSIHGVFDAPVQICRDGKLDSELTAVLLDEFADAYDDVRYNLVRPRVSTLQFNAAEVSHLLS